MTDAPAFVVRFSAAKVDRVDESDGVLVGYDQGGHIVDVAVRARNAPARLDFVERERSAVPARVTYDAEADAIAVDLDDSRHADSAEAGPDMIVDWDVDGFLRGLEFLFVSRWFSPEATAVVQRHAVLI